MQKKLLVVFLLIVCLSLTLSAAADDVIRVAIEPDTKPFKYFDQDEEIAGIDPEIMYAITGFMDVEFEFDVHNMENILSDVAECKVDMAISALTITDERSDQVAFSEPYAIGAQTIYAKADRKDIESLNAETVKTVGVKENTTSDENVTELANDSGFEVVRFTEYAELFSELENGGIDAAVADNFLAKQYLDLYDDLLAVGAPISEEPYAIAVCPENPELLDLINSGLDELRANGVIEHIIMDNLNK